MSKASEWAARAEECQQQYNRAYIELKEGVPKCVLSDDGYTMTLAMATPHGGLEIPCTLNLTAKAALFLAYWIIDTFGEPKP